LEKFSAMITLHFHHLDMLTVTETWLCSDCNTSIASILNSLNDFIVWQVPRVTGRGGGMAFFASKTPQ